jgi:hypothetical protein
MHDHSLSWIGTGTSIKTSGGVKLGLYFQTSPLITITKFGRFYDVY